jgi:hypothetical protein
MIVINTATKTSRQKVNVIIIIIISKHNKQLKIPSTHTTRTGVFSKESRKQMHPH